MRRLSQVNAASRPYAATRSSTTAIIESSPSKPRSIGRRGKLLRDEGVGDLVGHRMVADRDLCGGRGEILVPTATIGPDPPEPAVANSRSLPGL